MTDKFTEIGIPIFQFIFKRQSPGSIVWHYLRDPTFSRFDTILECDRQTDRQTHDDGIYRTLASPCFMEI